ncbi:WD40 repeat [Chlorella sorokiniana]|uniref:WD40 repeat n=1 Tax=Chlorella sorokiniana TaxID=3076 RepID=A0A2P6U3N0_CHLSO|nr:WD40 repeat [Chlorella sorokiniana]|eukprot:PRW60909.1 WD40 repeat [Chlorella sorokiniana]
MASSVHIPPLQPSSGPQTVTCDIVLGTPEDIRQVTTKLQAALALAQQRWGAAGRRPASAGIGPAAAAAAPMAAAAAAPLCWTTDAADHNGDPVTSMAYLPQVAGLPGGEGHAGWLVSSSRGLLNLWEASPSGGRGEAALMCMHSQGTDYTTVCLDGERSTRMLLGASMDRSGNEWVSASSLEVETLLAPKGRCPMPHSAASKIQGQNCLAVASLHSFGGPLAETVVASYGGALVCWSVGNASKPAASNSATPGSAAPKALWKAHDALITALHKSSFGLSLFSGAADGKVHMFNMREKPSRPTLEFSQQGRITGISQVNDSQLLTTAGDGRLMVWDLRNASAGPVKFAVPDARPIVRMAVSPFADSAAVATTGGLYTVDLLDSACSVHTIAPGAPRTPITALLWNSATSEVVAAGGPGGPGTISVFKARLGF